MNKIIKKIVLNPTVTQMELYAPLIASKAMPGQFVILRADENGERVPLTIADYNSESGTITIIFQIVGHATTALNALNENDYIADLVGPLGQPTHTDGLKKVCVVGGGVGCAIAYPVAKKLHEQGCEVHSIVGFRTNDLVILRQEFMAVSDKYVLMSDDGSAGEKGLVTDALRRLIESGEKYDEVITIGPLIMMKFVAKLTKEFSIKTVCSMNPIMIDGTGMCGGCRLNVGGKTVFACIDGPDFDAHEVDFDSAMQRGRMYDGIIKVAREDNCNLFPENTAEKEILKTADAAQEIPENPNKKNMSPKKNAMPLQEPDKRRHNFSEVALGYSAETAVSEAKRCLGCKNRPCVSGCPVSVKIPEFIAEIAEGHFENAYRVITETNSLPAVCGRVCPQENQCEGTCVRGIKGESVAIGRLERFAADYHAEKLSAQTGENKSAPKGNGFKAAVVGSGPAGLTCAGDLSKKGYDVTIFEALHLPGGVLVYGSPEFRLPKAIVAKEIDSLREGGVKIETNVVIGKTISMEELLQEYDAVFVGSGAGLPRFMNIPGEHLNGVYSANEFLTRVNLMKAYKEGASTPVMRAEQVAVVGGGNVAMDAARCALRLGAKEVSIVYRRSLDELPARREEVEHAMEEGVIFRLLTNPTEIHDDNGFVNGMTCVEMELGEPDASGRRSPAVKPGSEFVLPCDCVIMAIGTSPNPLIKSTTDGLETTKWGGIIADETTGATSLKGVYAGGDAVTGAATVILAMGAGKAAAKAIDEFCLSKNSEK
jgi:glutamate synthase (NADPH/NADH) small chain